MSINLKSWEDTAKKHRVVINADNYKELSCCAVSISISPADITEKNHEFWSDKDGNPINFKILYFLEPLDYTDTIGYACIDISDEQSVEFYKITFVNEDGNNVRIRNEEITGQSYYLKPNETPIKLDVHLLYNIEEDEMAKWFHEASFCREGRFYLYERRKKLLVNSQGSKTDSRWHQIVSIIWKLAQNITAFLIIFAMFNKANSSFEIIIVGTMAIIYITIRTLSLAHWSSVQQSAAQFMAIGLMLNDPDFNQELLNKNMAERKKMMVSYYIEGIALSLFFFFALYKIIVSFSH